LYTEQEWEERMKYYRNAIKEISIPQSIENSSQLQMIVSAMDKVLNEIFFDLSEAEDIYDIASSAYQTRTSVYFLQGKESPGKGRGGGMSDEKAKNYSRVKVDGEGYLVERQKAERVKIFMKNVVSLLQEKRNLLMISYGTTKLESKMNPLGTGP